MNRKLILAAVALFLLAFFILPTDAQYRRVQRQRLVGQPTQAQVNQVTQQWPEAARQAAQDTIAKYGLPHEGTDSALTWHNVTPWKRIVAHRDEVPHNVPAEHADVLEYVVAMQVPPDRFDDLAEFNGSVTASRTKGELSVRCENEAVNILTLNLAEDIVRQNRSIEQARTMLSNKSDELARGVRPAEARRLTFRTLGNQFGDPDQAVRAANPPR